MSSSSNLHHRDCRNSVPWTRHPETPPAEEQEKERTRRRGIAAVVGRVPLFFFSNVGSRLGRQDSDLGPHSELLRWSHRRPAARNSRRENNLDASSEAARCCWFPHPKTRPPRSNQLPVASGARRLRHVDKTINPVCGFWATPGLVRRQERRARDREVKVLTGVLSATRGCGWLLLAPAGPQSQPFP